MQVIEPEDQDKKKQTGKQLKFPSASGKPTSTSVGRPSINFPKSVVPGTKLLKDPLSSAFVLEKTFKIMGSFFQQAADTDFQEISAIYADINAKVSNTRKTFLVKGEEEEASFKEVKFIKTCQLEGRETQDQTAEAWLQFRKLLCAIARKHKHIDL